MRVRSIRLSVLILLILAISLAALGFNEVNIDVPGFPELKRGGTGPLGLKLGLDLRGGGHLVYQADTGTRIDATFSGPVTTDEIREVVQGLNLSGFEIVQRGGQTFRIKTALLDVATGDQLLLALEAAFGTTVSYSVTDVEAPDADAMEGVLDIIGRRVNLFGTEEPIIQRFGDDRIIVQLPGASGSITEVEFSEAVDEEDLLSVVADNDLQNYSVSASDDRKGFKIKSDTLSADMQQALNASLAEQLGAIVSFEVASGIDEAKSLIGETALLEFKERTCTNGTCTEFTDSDLGLTGDNLSNAYASTDPVRGWVVNLQFDGQGSDIFSELTGRIFTQRDTKRISFFLDGEFLLAPVAQAHIRDGRTQISGRFTREEARKLAIQVNAGSLPVPLKLIQESDVDALLGSESLRNSLLAGFVGLGLVLVFMVAYYRMAGVVAAVALVFYSIVVLAVFKLIPITLTLSHVGGFILSVGMAVDANILIFERMKEELRIGRTLASSMEVGFNRAWPAIRDGNLSTLITCGVLLWFGDRLGGGLITGFAISLGLGVMISMFTAVVLSRNLLQLLAWAGFSGRISLFTPESRPGAQPAGGSS